MINLYKDFTLYYDFGNIDIFDIYDLFNNSNMYNLFPFQNVYLEIKLIHTNFNNNNLKLIINNDIKYETITNYNTIKLIESIVQYIKNIK